MDMLMFMIYSKSWEYAYCIMVSMIHMQYLEEEDHVVWNLISKFCSNLNEEICEISLSHLARYHPSAKVRSTRTLMDRYFRLLPVTSRIEEFDQLPSELKRPSGYFKIKLDGPEMIATAAFFSRNIRLLATGQYRHYTGSPDTWTNIVEATKTAANFEPSPFLSSKWFDQIDDYKSRLRKRFVTTWSEKYRAIIQQDITSYDKEAKSRLHDEITEPEEADDTVGLHDLSVDIETTIEGARPEEDEALDLKHSNLRDAHSDSDEKHLPRKRSKKRKATLDQSGQEQQDSPVDSDPDFIPPPSQSRSIPINEQTTNNRPKRQCQKKEILDL